MRRTVVKISVVLAIISIPAVSRAHDFDDLLARFLFGTTPSGYCYNYMSRTTYDSGFSSSDFDNMTSMSVTGGKLVFHNDRRALDDPNHITLPTDQHLRIKYVYEGADMAQMLGYFVFDNRIKQFLRQSGWVITYRTCSSDSDCQQGESCITYGSGKRCMYPYYLLKDSGVTIPGVAYSGNSNGLFDWIEAIYHKPGDSTNPFVVPELLNPIDNNYFVAWDSRSSNIESRYGRTYAYYEKTARYITNNDHYYNYYNMRAMYDGGSLDHVSNFIEWLVGTGGKWIYYNTDDDSDYHGTWGGIRIFRQGWRGWWDGLQLRGSQYSDVSSSVDGIPDYDVNGDGSIDSSDRTVDLGNFSAGTELVFFINNFYYNWFARYETVGMHKPHPNAPDWVRTITIPYFSKHILNPDFEPDSSNPNTWDTSYTRYRGIDIGWPQFNGPGCTYTYYSGYSVWYNVCAYYTGSYWVVGWLDKNVLNRLNTATYNYINMPREVKLVYTTYKGLRRHIMVGAPSNDPTRWILGFEQLYDSGRDDLLWTDYNDAVFVVERTNGGQAVSGIVSGEIPASQLANTTITKVQICKNDSIPIPPCSSYPDTRIEYYVSINENAAGEPIWIKVQFPAGQNCASLDLAAMGYTGAKLRWKAVVITDVETCEPEINDVDIGYEAMVHGDYAFNSPLPLANVLFKGSLETPSSSWTVTGGDTRNRGHYRLIEIYDPGNPSTTTLTTKWDAGAVLKNRDPKSRTVYTQKADKRISFNPYKSGFDSWVYWKVLDSSARNEIYNGRKVYDLYADGNVDNYDALKIIRWTLGFEEKHYKHAWTTQRRAWYLGAIHRSVAAIVHPPGKPAWLYGRNVPAAYKSSYMTWADSLKERRTVAVVGAQDGMLHAFDAGAFRWGDNPSTTTQEQRGYFAYNAGQPDYGTGEEVWAWIPPAQLQYIRNNYVKDYLPATHPWAMIDGSVALEDVLYKSNWITALFYSHGRNYPYISAIDITDTASPQPMWDHDWTDPFYHGTYQPPSVAWVNTSSYGSFGMGWLVYTTSGMSESPGDVYLYAIDVNTGLTRTNGRIKLNNGSGSAGAQTTGVWGAPVVIDSDGDGFADRVYVADTNGRVWRHDPEGTSGNVCLVADVGQPIYSTPAVKVAQDASTGQKVVLIYFGTSDSPDMDDTTSPPYAFYGFADRASTGSCASADLIYQYDLPPDEKVWGDPFISGDRVYFATSTGAKADICDEDPTNPGEIYALSLEARPDGLPVTVDKFNAGGNVVTGVYAYDEHLFVNTLGGKTKIIGNNSWNNTPASAAASTGVQDLYWKEW